MPEFEVEWDHDQFKTDVLAFQQRQGYTLNQLAAKARVHHATLYKWVNHDRHLSLEVTVKLGSLCDLRLDDYVKEVAA